MIAGGWLLALTLLADGERSPQDIPGPGERDVRSSLLLARIVTAGALGYTQKRKAKSSWHPSDQVPGEGKRSSTG